MLPLRWGVEVRAGGACGAVLLLLLTGGCMMMVRMAPKSEQEEESKQRQGFHSKHGILEHEPQLAVRNLRAR